jgi:hypothetical protein
MMRPPALRQRPSSSWILSIFIILGVFILLGRTATTTWGFRPTSYTNRRTLLRKSPYSGRRYIVPPDHVHPQQQWSFLAATSQDGDEEDVAAAAAAAVAYTAGPTTASSPITTTRILEGEDVPRYDNDALTKEELALRFQDVLAHYRTTTTTSPEQLSLETVRYNLLCTRLPNLQLDRCRVAPSTIPNAGMGVFSTRDIKAGELITLFPGDALLLWNDEVGVLRGGLTVRCGPHIVHAAEDRDDVAAHFTSAEARRYELKIGFRESIVADVRITTTTDGPTININNNADYLAHMINDGACLRTTTGTAATAKAAEQEYESMSYRRHNAAICDVYGGCHYMAVATKDIAKDEEIFVSYGIGYWSSRLTVETTATTTTMVSSSKEERPKKPPPSASRSKNTRRSSSSNNKQQSNKKGFA